uniref:Uncharacterized protein n=1 Tax=Bionectria ochroleuca TaxID=29856 RepID=A0A8H7TV98_BIOOC
MGAMVTKEVINGQRREGMETQVSDAEFIPGRVDESPLPGTMPGSNPKRRIKSFPTADSVVCDLTGDSYNDNGRGRSRGSGPATSSPLPETPTRSHVGPRPRKHQREHQLIKALLITREKMRMILAAAVFRGDRRVQNPRAHAVLSSSQCRSRG